MPKRDRGDELGRSLVQLLRHGAHEANVPIDDEGWVALDAALAHVNRRGKSFTVADVEQSVAACAKQRMALRTSPAGARQIRANQGHSMKDVHVEMKRLDAASAPEAVVHGTYRAAWATIDLLEHLDEFAYADLGQAPQLRPSAPDQVDGEVLRELRRAEAHFTAGGGFVGAHYFVHRWKGHAIPDAPDLRRQSVQRLLASGLAETYQVDGKTALRAAPTADE